MPLYPPSSFSFDPFVSVPSEQNVSVSVPFEQNASVSVPSEQNVSVPPNHVVQSSPTKPANRMIDNRKDIADSKHAKSTKTDSNFLTKHLTSPPSDVQWSDSKEDETDFDKIKKGTTREDVLYGPLSNILTRYSERIYSSYFRTISVKLLLMLRSLRVTDNVIDRSPPCLHVPGLSQLFSNTSSI